MNTSASCTPSERESYVLRQFNFYCHHTHRARGANVAALMDEAAEIFSRRGETYASSIDLRACLSLAQEAREK